MNVLLDTCTFLWAVLDPDHLTPVARDLFQDPAHDVFLSAASVWEISIKHGSGKLRLPADPAAFVPRERQRHGLLPLPIDEEAALMQARLPSLHRDPFDRILVCQALVSGLVLVTPDPLITAYPVRVAW